MFGPPGGGKSHLAAAIGLALIENGWRVLFTRTTDLVQKLQVARRELQLESAIDKLNKYDLLILDDLAYVTKDQAETSVLFELISARYEYRSILITANQPFGEWNRVFPDPAMTVTVSSNVDGQIREEIKTLKDTVEKNHEAVAPTLEEWKKMKTLGYGIPGADRVRGPDHWRHHCLCQRWGSGGASALVED